MLWFATAETPERVFFLNAIRNPIVVDGKCEILTIRYGFYLFLFLFSTKLLTIRCRGRERQYCRR